MTGQGAIERLQELIVVPTVSDRDPTRVDEPAFEEFVATLERCFPLLHDTLELTRVGRHGLLFRWPSRRYAQTARPIVLMAHLDVVPVEQEAPWQHPPFGAEIHDDAIWGRGTLDDKGSLAAICEAVEQLLADGFRPAQDVWLSFGCDEEVSGDAAALAVAELRQRAVRPWFVLDEGGAVAHDALPGVRPPVAVIGVTEKGTTSLLLSVEGRGGHASTPERGGPTARLARAILRLERSPFPASTPAPTIELLRRVGPHAPRPLRPALSALLRRGERIAPLLTRALVAAGPETAAMTRTTVAVTTLSGSPALNVVASSATAGVNIRVMTGETVAGAVAHVRRAIRDDSVHIEVIEAGEPSPVSPYTDDEAFALLEQTIGEVFPDAIAAPYVMMAATDSRHFTAICDRVYRFAPFRMTRAQREAIHSYDEHLGVADYLAGIGWYRRLIEGLR